MGALVAVVAKNKSNIVPYVAKSLRVLEHRGRDSHGISSSHFATKAKDLDDINLSDYSATAALGHNLAVVLPSDAPQPIMRDKASLVFEGRLFPIESRNEPCAILDVLKTEPYEQALRLVKDHEGSYVFAFLDGNLLIVGRDAFGTVPLYYGGNDQIFGLASERKGLWAIGIRDVRSFPPGNIAVIERGWLELHVASTVEKPFVRLSNEKKAIDHLHRLLLQSIEQRVQGRGRVAVAFSGGLDSSIVAFLAKQTGIEVDLISVGLRGEEEIVFAKKISEMMDLPLSERISTPSDIEQVLPVILWLIEEPDVMKTSIAIPLFWATETAAKSDFKILLTGQGSDELFGGYRRYLSQYAKSLGDLEQTLYQDIKLAYEVNFERDNKICASQGVELRLPFVDQNLVSFCLSLPASMKIGFPTDPLRKIILRKLAKKIGLPRDVYERPKKAIQYSTGVSRCLRRLAKERGMSVYRFLNETFRNIMHEKFGSVNDPFWQEGCAW